jgi:hypothetical protein
MSIFMGTDSKLQALFEARHQLKRFCELGTNRPFVSAHIFYMRELLPIAQLLAGRGQAGSRDQPSSILS